MLCLCHAHDGEDLHEAFLSSHLVSFWFIKKLNNNHFYSQGASAAPQPGLFDIIFAPIQIISNVISGVVGVAANATAAIINGVNAGFNGEFS